MAFGLLTRPRPEFFWLRPQLRLFGGRGGDGGSNGAVPGGGGGASTGTGGNGGDGVVRVWVYRGS